MLRTRTLTALALAALGIPAIVLGGIYFFAIITLFLVVAAWEFGNLFRAAGFQASTALLVGGVFLLVLARSFFPEFTPALLAGLVLAAMTWHLVAYERGRDAAATDFTVTLAGILYLGWIGPYLMELRALENGLWWLLVVFPAVWAADGGAYFIGKAFGRHALSPRLSPKKTWEGYWGGVLCGTLAGAGFTLLWARLADLPATWWQGALLGLVLALLTTLGDLGESMLKRQAGLKDSSSIFPGHGGALDRIDSWLWGGVLGYYLIVWFLL